MKKNYFYLPLFLIFIFMVGCEKEEINEPVGKDALSSIDTVQKKVAVENEATSTNSKGSKCD